MEMPSVITLGKEEDSKRIPGHICNICGNQGVSNALILCSECSDTVVHMYCVGILPRNIDDTFQWVCEYCSSQMFSTEGAPECSINIEPSKMKSKSQIIVVPDKPEPLSWLPPVSYYVYWECVKRRNLFEGVNKTRRTTSTFSADSLGYKDDHEVSVSSYMENPDSIMTGLVLLVSPLGEIFIDQYMDFCDDLDSPTSEGFLRTSPVCTRDSENYGAEASVFSLMESPKEIDGGIVLLASLSGDVFICRDLASYENFNSPTWVNPIHGLIRSSEEASSDVLVRNLGPYEVKPDSSFADILANKSGEISHDCSMRESMCAKEPNLALIDEYLGDYGRPSNEASKLNGSKRKRKTLVSSLNISDLIQSVGHECKRSRRQRRRFKISSPKEDDCNAAIVVGLPSIGSGDEQGIKRKMGTSLSSYMKYDLLPPLRPECKRPRSKRWKVRSARPTNVQDTKFILRKRLDKQPQAGGLAPGDVFAGGTVLDEAVNKEEHVADDIMEMMNTETEKVSTMSLRNGFNDLISDQKTGGWFGGIYDIGGSSVNENARVIGRSDGQDFKGPAIHLVDSREDIMKSPKLHHNPSADLSFHQVGMSKCGSWHAPGLASLVDVASNSDVILSETFQQKSDLGFRSGKLGSERQSVTEEATKNRGFNSESDIMVDTHEHYSSGGDLEALVNGILNSCREGQNIRLSAGMEKEYKAVHEKTFNQSAQLEEICFATEDEFENISFGTPKPKQPLHKEVKSSNECCMSDELIEKATSLIGVDAFKDKKFNEDYRPNQLWLAGYGSALRVIRQLYPNLKLNFEAIEGVGNLLSLQIKSNVD